MKICFVLGTRPEIIKLYSTIKECQSKKINFFIIHTNQHYAKELDGVFFKELDLPSPKYNLHVGSQSHAEQTAKMLTGIEEILLREHPDVVIVQGDTNSTLAGCLAAVKLHIKTAHIEAGLRSYDRRMPEEINRVVVDHLADILFAPTKGAGKILQNEGVSKKNIIVTGNTIVDVLKSNQLSRNTSDIVRENNLCKKKYLLLTIHRAENTDNYTRLVSIFNVLDTVRKRYRFPIIYPIHPRTQKMIQKFHISPPEGLVLIPPIGYTDFLMLERYARLVLTDSGGVQEEACILRIPCVTLRDTTERPETVQVGANRVAGIEEESILEAIEYMMKRKTAWRNPFGSGKASKKIIEYLLA